MFNLLFGRRPSYHLDHIKELTEAMKVLREPLFKTVTVTSYKDDDEAEAQCLESSARAIVNDITKLMVEVSSEVEDSAILDALNSDLSNARRLVGNAMLTLSNLKDTDDSDDDDGDCDEWEHHCDCSSCKYRKDKEANPIPNEKYVHKNDNKVTPQYDLNIKPQDIDDILIGVSDGYVDPNQLHYYNKPGNPKWNREIYLKQKRNRVNRSINRKLRARLMNAMKDAD